jgi:hypothetical protein
MRSNDRGTVPYPVRKRRTGKVEVNEWEELLNLFTFLREYHLGIEPNGEFPHDS